MLQKLYPSLNMAENLYNSHKYYTPSGKTKNFFFFFLLYKQIQNSLCFAVVIVLVLHKDLLEG